MTHKELRQEYYNLIELLNINMMTQLKYSIRNDETIQASKLRRGVIYVINQVGTNNYKIGISTNYDERLKLFTVKLPFDIKEHAVYETERYAEKEKELHFFFHEKRLNGSEFFELTPEDLQLIPDIIYRKGVIEDSGLEEPDGISEPILDDLIEQAKIAIRIEGKASTSFLQRKLRIGYSRAARLIDYLEEEGFVGALNGAKPRELLIIEQLTSDETTPDHTE